MNDQRPEEITYFRRSVAAEVLSSSSDQSMKVHVELVEMTLAHIQQLSKLRRMLAARKPGEAMESLIKRKVYFRV